MALVKAVAEPTPDTNSCLSKEVIIKNGGKIVLNDNGAINVFYNDPKIGLYPVPLSLYCCKLLDKTYYFDINTQTCKWSEPKTCGFGEPINLIVNPKGNDGSLFYVDISDNENCSLKISFDYLLKVKCEDLNNLLNPTISSQSLETQQEIYKTQVKIQAINAQIESTSNQIYNLNQLYINTPYSMYCGQYPVTITTPDPVNCTVSAWGAWSDCVKGVQTHTRTITSPALNGGTCLPLTETQACTTACVRPATTYISLQTGQNGVNFTNSAANACAALANAVAGFNGTSAKVTNLINGGYVYLDNGTNDCTFFPNGYYIVNTGVGINKVIQITNGVITFIDCGTACVPPANMIPISLGFQDIAAGFTTEAIACNAITSALITGAVGPAYAVSFAVGSQLYFNKTTCDKFNGTGWWSSLDGTRRTVHVVNGIITEINPCPNTTLPSNAKMAAVTTTAKMAAFDNSGFIPKSLTESIAVADSVVYQRGSTTTYVTKNLCLTEPYGLELWASILGPIRYQQFILGDPTSYTCADVIAINTHINAAQAVYECTTPFGTKSEILVEINTLMTQLTNYNIELTTLENILIKLQNDFIQSQNDSKGCKTPVDALEAMDVEMFLDIVTGTTNTLVPISGFTFFPKIGTGNLYNYLSNPLQPNSGFYICGDPSNSDTGLSNCTTLSLNTNGDGTTNVFSCEQLIEDMLNQLYVESGLTDEDAFNQTIPSNALSSQWLTYSTVITDPAIIAAITNQKIKISFKIKYSCVDFCLLLDNLVLDKTCTHVDKTEIIIPQSPGFDFQRVIDNKKSWIDTTAPTERLFHIAKFDETNPTRQTDYNVNDERLVLNTKEIDLDISVASAIETDVWCYLNDNLCALTAACTSTIASTTNNPYYEGQTIVFSGTPSTIVDCTDYNSILVDRLPELIETTSCGTILRFKIKTGLIPFQVIYYYWVIEQPNGDLEFYYQNATTFTNLSNVYQNGKNCCEYLNIDLKRYNNSVGVDDKMTVYWDEDCQRCKVEKSKCGDVNIDFHALLTQPISGVTTIEGFENLLISELIDVKNRQTITSYATLRALYERYLNSSEYCSTNSSAFTYESMDAFAGLVGNYWIDLIEQVVPSTTIWGSVKIYTNTIFDEQKFKYKSYSSLLCGNPFIGEHVLSPINGVYGETASPNVTYYNLINNRVNSSIKRYANPNDIKQCDSINIAQMNSGSEFISYIQIELPEIIIPCNDCNDGKIDLSSLGDFNLYYMVNNSDNTKMYVGSYEGHIIVINTLTDTVTTTISTYPNNGIRRMVYSPNNKLYAICELSDAVIVIDTLTDTIIGSPIYVGAIPSEGIYVPYNGYLYVLNTDSDNVSVINTTTDLIVTTIPVGSFPKNIVYNSDLRLLYVSNVNSGTISVINVVTNTVTGTIPVGSMVSSLYMYYVSHNQHLYVYNSVDSKLLVIDTSTSTVLTVLVIQGGDMTYNPSNKYLYLSSGSIMSIIDTTTDTSPAKPSVNTTKSIYASSTNNIYAGYGYGTLTTIDASNTAVEVRNVPSKAASAIFNPSNETIYVSSWNTITIFKCINNKPKTPIIINENDLSVKITSTISNGVTTLTSNTTGGNAPFTYLWNNGATTKSINVSNGGYYSVKVTDSKCYSAKDTFDILNRTACWYNLPESPEYLNNQIVCGRVPSRTMTITSLKIDGHEKITGTQPSITLDKTNINWVSSNNLVVSACTTPSTTGITYTNFVELLNDTFTDLGLTGYRAEISHKQRVVQNQNQNKQKDYKNSGFYIVSLIGVPFEIIVEQDTEYPLKYTNNSLTIHTPPYIDFTKEYYFTMTCDVIYNNTTDKITEVSDCVQGLVFGPCVGGYRTVTDTIMIPAENGGAGCTIIPPYTQQC